MCCPMFHLWWVLFRISGGVARTTNIHSTVTKQIQMTRARCNWKVLGSLFVASSYFSVANGGSIRSANCVCVCVLLLNK